MTEQYDVIVVGAGPAGSTAARYAAEGGAKTLLLEKHPVIGYPLCCAEAISISGLAQVVEPQARWIASKIEKVRLFSPDGGYAKILHPNAGYMLKRKLFDRDLADIAAKAGAEVRVGVDVRELLHDSKDKIVGVRAQENGHSRELRGKVIIAADGVESETARKAGLKSLLKPRQLHSAYQYLLADIDIEPETLEFYFGNKIAPGGYIWVFCKGQRSANVGIGVCPSRSPRRKAIEFLNEFVERRFKHYKIIERMTGGVPSYMPDLPLYKDNILLAGDAARVVDSLTGAGIANALLSGKLAGRTAAKMINDGVTGKLYADEFNKIKQKELRYYFYCREIFLKLTDDDFVSILRFTNDMFGDRDVTAINPFDVVKRIILAHPRLLKIGRHVLF